MCQRSQPAGFVDALLDVFFLQAAEEEFCDSIVPAVSSAAHAELEINAATKATPIVTTLLAALVRMNDCAFPATRLDRFHHRIEHEFFMHSR